MRIKFNMNRYLSSFIISTIFYTFVGASLFYFFIIKKDDNDKNHKVEKIQKINFSIISQATEIKKEEILKPIKKKPLTKPTEKKQISKPIEKKPTPTPLKKEPVVEQAEPKHVQKTQEEPIQKKHIEDKKPIPHVDKVVQNDTKERDREIFIQNLIKRINENKSYPHTARRRSIQDTIEVEFIILADGNVDYIKMVSGKNIFEKSATEAIENSFPIEIEKTLFDFPKKFKVKIAYILK